MSLDNRSNKPDFTKVPTYEEIASAVTSETLGSPVPGGITDADTGGEYGATPIPGMDGISGKKLDDSSEISKRRKDDRLQAIDEDALERYYRAFQPPTRREYGPAMTPAAPAPAPQAPPAQTGFSLSRNDRDAILLAIITLAIIYPYLQLVFLGYVPSWTMDKPLMTGVLLMVTIVGVYYIAKRRGF